MMENPLAENKEPTQMTNLSPGKVAIPFENIELEDDTIGGCKYNWLFLWTTTTTFFIGTYSWEGYNH